MPSSFGFGVIGTGQIAEAFVVALGDSRRCRAVQALGSSPEKGLLFAERFGLTTAATLDELLANPALDAVYVAVPHPLHEHFAVRAAQAGKHVLCEKPLTTEVSSTMRVLEAAQRAGVVLMEAFMYRCHPVIAVLLERLAQGVIGRLVRLESDFCFEAPFDPRSRLFCKELGGGAILDVGGYPVSFARLLAGAAEGKPFAEPVQLSASGEVGPTGVDVFACAELVFASGFTAGLRCATRRALGTRSVIFGESGRIELPDVWLPKGHRQGRTNGFEIWGQDSSAEQVEVSASLAPFALEAECLADAVASGQVPHPALSPQDTLGNMRVMEAWRAALGGS